LPPLFIEDDRQQRAAMVLKASKAEGQDDPPRIEYLIEAEFEVLSDEQIAAKGFDVEDRKPDDRTDGKHIDQFRRRARGGRCYKQPVFGCREFPAFFELIEDNEALPISCYADKDEKNLGWMLFDMDFANPADIRPMFFQATMTNGVVEVPPPDSEEVKR
jgi:CRISPR-associated protein Cas5d